MSSTARLLKPTLAIIVASLAAGCGGDSSTTPPEPDPVATVVVAPTADTILVGEGTTLQATARTQAGAVVQGVSIAWTSGNDLVATVDAQGRVDGVSPGSVTITARADGRSGTATIVVQPRPVTLVTIAPTLDTLRVGDIVTLVATRFDDRGDESSAAVEWSSDDPTIATAENASAVGPGVAPGFAAGSSAALVVSSPGIVTGVSPGTATIRASVGAVSGIATVVVEPQPVAVVDVSPPATTLRVGRTVQLAAVPRTATGAEVTGCAIGWLATDGAVADVSGAGFATALGAGTTTVTATADCGAAGTAQGIADLSVDPSRIVAVGTGRTFSCALVEDARLDALDQGAAYCWGANHNGQVGDGTTFDRSSPTRVPFPGVFGGSPDGSNPSRRASELLVVGDEHACALTPDGAAWCWGDNFFGQLGDGTFVDRFTPVPVQGGHDFVALTAGEEYTCGLDTAGLAWCWGQGSDGQIGDGDLDNETTPVPVSGGHTWTFLRAGEDNVCGITTAGATWCWGDNSEGTVGDGTSGVDRRVPTLVQGPTAGAPPLDFSWLGVGNEFVCGLESSTGTAWCWGSNNRGQLGIGTTGGIRTRPTPVIGPNNVFRTLFDSGDDDVFTACGIAASAADFGGQAYCWGANNLGQLGDGTIVDRPAPTPLASTESFLLISPAEFHACGLTTEWRLMCWGSDSRGQLGNGPPLTGTPTPTFVPFPAGAPLPAGSGGS